MAPRRDAILSGASRAAELHAELGLRDRLTAGDSPVDVLDVAHQIGLLVLFRPLTSLLGAYVPAAGTAGVLVTTRRDMHVQRFTAAHELGHHVLQHKVVSLDAEGHRGSKESMDNGQGSRRAQLVSGMRC